MLYNYKDAPSTLRATDCVAFLDPGGRTAGLTLAWLRRAARGHTNLAAALAHHKLTFDALTVGSNWRPRCARFDLLLPTGTPDVFTDPATLFMALDRHVDSPAADLLLLMTAWTPVPESLNDGFELVRAFARERLVAARGLGALVTLHDPSRIARPPAVDHHVHVLATARPIGRGGLEGGTTDLAGDAGLATIAREWVEFRAAACASPPRPTAARARTKRKTANARAKP